jgi:hypothetical protein
LQRSASDPQGWRAGTRPHGAADWKCDSDTQPVAPRWTVGRAGRHWNQAGELDAEAWKAGRVIGGHKVSAFGREQLGGGQFEKDPKDQNKGSATTRFTLGGGYRDSWIQVHCRKNRNPGPGHYRKDTEMPVNGFKPIDGWNTQGSYTLPFKERPTAGKNTPQALDVKTRAGSTEYCLSAAGDEFNANNTRKERGPKYTIDSNLEKETSKTWTHVKKDAQGRENSMESIKLSCLKASNLCVPVRKGGGGTGFNSREVQVTPGPGHYTQHTSFGAASGGHRIHYLGLHNPPNWANKDRDRMHAQDANSTRRSQ